MEFLAQEFYGNSVRAWLLAVATAVLLSIILRFLLSIVVGRLSSLARRTKIQWDDIISACMKRTKFYFLVVVAIYIAARPLELSPGIRSVLRGVFWLAMLIQVGIWLTAAISAWLKEYHEKKLQKDAAAVTTMSALGFVAKLIVWSGVLLLALDNLGIQITTLVAGLGVGGIAAALAVQNILSDLFASLSIVLDKPFVIGDFVIVDNLMGTVEHVGLKTTRVRSLSGEQLIFSNTDLLQSRLRNFGRMYERRVVFTIGVTYQTPREKLAKIPEIIKGAIEAQEKTRFDRSHLKQFGAYSIDYETVYYVLVPSYNVYMDVQQAINLKIHEDFEKEGIEFAYPTQTIFVDQAKEE